MAYSPALGSADYGIGAFDRTQLLDAASGCASRSREVDTSVNLFGIKCYPTVSGEVR